MLGSALEHVKTREQFGRPLGSFQAVKHALADVRVWLECALLAADAAWEDDRPESAEMAKILAGRLFRTAAANCQQVLGGMGFTWEHEFHRYLRRGLVLEPLLGSAAQLRGVLGARVRTTGVPQLAQL
jgi:alkylation response protein AidB-like acyl-CoA dehydrogenase